jgi:hypothetical protein
MKNNNINYYTSLNLKWNEWNEELPIKVNSMKYNSNATLFTLATQKGYRIFSTKSLLMFKKISNENKNLGNLILANSFFRSRFVFIVGDEKYKSNELLIFDDIYGKIFSKITFKETEKINDFNLTLNFIFVYAGYNLVVIEINNFTIKSIINNVKQIAYNSLDMIAYLDKKENNTVYINIFKTENHVSTNIFRNSFGVKFNKISNIQLSNNGNFILIVSENNIKFHIYNIKNNELKFCLYTGKYIDSIYNIYFNNNDSSIMYVSSENLLIIFDIITDDDFVICTCENNIDDKNISEKENFFDFFQKYKNYDVK